MKLYTYFRSSASYRVRIVLHLKGLATEQAFVHLVKDEHLSASYRAVNPDGVVPSLVEDDTVLTQSVAICEYLNDIHPEPPILPADARARAQVRALALAVACDIHPVNNLRVLRYLERELKVDKPARDAWYHHWIRSGLAAVETTLVRLGSNGQFCFGHSPTLADVCLIPQVFNAHRFGVDLSAMPLVESINAHCLSIEAFAQAAPAVQPDAS